MPIITRAKPCISAVFRALVPFLFFSGLPARADWTVDFSRRKQETRIQDLREPASGEIQVSVPSGGSPMPAPANSEPGFFESLLNPAEIAEEIVILNTEKGFVPSTVRVKKGLNYQVHVVNVNEKEKNVSFVLDSFSEHHATYYGKIKTFVIRPQKEGVYRFVSPETSGQGKLVVVPQSPRDGRAPASVE